MLSTIKISNLAVIESLEIHFTNGLNIFTGETGAGKSIVLSALSLILGERASSGLLRSGCPIASVEALFDTGPDPRIVELLAQTGLVAEEDHSLIVRREITVEGKSRCHVNGRLVGLSFLKELGNLLVDLHGQHEHQLLLDPRHQLEILDSFGDAGHQKVRVAVQSDVRRLLDVRRERASLRQRATEREAEIELVSTQLAEIEAAAVDPETDAAVEGQLKLLANLERVKREAMELSTGLAGDDGQGQAVLTSLRALLPRLEYLAQTTGRAEVAQALDNFREALYLLEDTSRTVSHAFDGLDLDEDDLARVEARVGVLTKLKRRYGPGLQDVADHARRLGSRLADLQAAHDDSARLEQAERQLVGRLNGSVPRLSGGRGRLSRQLVRRVEEHLADLGLENARFEVALSRQEEADSPVSIESSGVHLYSNGADRVEFLIAPNPGEPPKPLSKIASGGELSRIMLAIKCSLAVVDKVPIMVFDEVDAGIDGRTAVKVAEKLAQLSARCQSLVITHSPQIASAATSHFAVKKQVSGGRTQTSVLRLDAEERVAEAQRRYESLEATEELRHRRQEGVRQRRRVAGGRRSRSPVARSESRRPSSLRGTSRRPSGTSSNGWAPGLRTRRSWESPVVERPSSWRRSSRRSTGRAW
ncbi:MAG: DNA repair protein RecN [Candidatus Riflebacteria bacterium]|nr:DNA repair protein RecN [Candidatus Riflebacteria bacterium]